MQLAVTVVGKDLPGIVCEVSTLLSESGCNIDNVSQTVLHYVFAGIFVITPPRDMDEARVQERLSLALQEKGLQVSAQALEEGEGSSLGDTEPFVVVCIGRDRLGLVSTVTCVMKEYGVNIVNMQFVGESSSFPGKTVSIYEVEVPRGQDLSRFAASLQSRAEEVGLEVSVQHKRIFADICRI